MAEKKYLEGEDPEAGLLKRFRVPTFLAGAIAIGVLLYRGDCNTLLAGFDDGKFAGVADALREHDKSVKQRRDPTHGKITLNNESK